jgi:gas vesicle protein
VVESENKKSIGFVSGLALGGIVAAAAAFFYKTKKGRVIRQRFSRDYDSAVVYLGKLVKDIKKEAEKLELDLERSNRVIERKTKSVAAKTRKVFKHLGKPLAK